MTNHLQTRGMYMLLNVLIFSFPQTLWGEHATTSPQRSEVEDVVDSDLATQIPEGTKFTLKSDVTLKARTRWTPIGNSKIENWLQKDAKDNNSFDLPNIILIKNISKEGFGCFIQHEAIGTERKISKDVVFHILPEVTKSKYTYKQKTPDYWEDKFIPYRHEWVTFKAQTEKQKAEFVFSCFVNEEKPGDAPFAARTVPKIKFVKKYLSLSFPPPAPIEE